LRSAAAAQAAAARRPTRPTVVVVAELVGYELTILDYRQQFLQRNLIVVDSCHSQHRQPILLGSEQGV
jgi:acetyl-CoA carboxylase alpha subunit